MRSPLPQPIKLSDAGPPPNANFYPDGKHESLQGHGSPEGLVLGDVGDEYLDLDSGDKWNKIEGVGITAGWQADSSSEAAEITSTGTTEPRTVGDRWAESRNVKDFGALTNGTNARAAIVAALAAWDVIRFSTGSYSVASDLTIAAGKVLVFEPGAKLKPASGVKITINGEVQAGRHEIFDYSAGGKVVLGSFSRTAAILPEWYGAVADASTNNDTAFGRIFDQTLTSSENTQQVLCLPSYYNFVAGFTLRTKSIIRGVESQRTRFRYIPTANGRLMTLPDQVDRIRIEGIQLEAVVASIADGVRTTAIGHASASHHVSNLYFRDVDFSGFNQYGVNLGQALYVTFNSCEGSVSNITANKGTGAGQAIFFNAQQFANVVVFKGESHFGDCDALFYSANTTTLKIHDGCSFECSSELLDAVTGRTHFIDVTGGAVTIIGNYFEGINTATAKAIVRLNAVRAALITGNQCTSPKQGESDAITARWVMSEGVTHGVNVSNNYFVGVTEYYIHSDGAGGKIFALDNVYANAVGTILSTHTSVSPFISIQHVEFTTATEWDFNRPITTRMYRNSTAAVTALTLEKVRTNGAGSANDGVVINARSTDDSGAQANLANVKFVFSNPAAGVEDSFMSVELLGNGTLTEQFRLLGEGGFNMPVAKTNPAAPSANNAVLYVDSSGGKVRLMARFPTGAAVQIGIEP